MRGRVILTLARREWQSAMAARWFWFYGAAMGLLGAGLLWLGSGMVPAGLPADSAGGRVLMTTVSLLALLVPLMGLTAGTQSLAGERDSRLLGYLMTQPVTREEVLTGKLAGNGAALGAALAGVGLLMFLTAGLLGVPLPALTLASVAGLAWLLALSSLALGAVIGAGTVGMASAQGVVLTVWLVMILLGDLGSMALVLLRRLPVQALLGVTLLNPVHQFRLAAVALFQPTLEILGPAGLYAESRLGSWLIPGLVLSQLAFLTAAVLVAQERFRRSWFAS